MQSSISGILIAIVLAGMLAVGGLFMVRRWLAALRNQAHDLDEARHDMLRRSFKLRQELLLIARSLPDGLDEPYAGLVQQARQALSQGFHHLDDLRAAGKSKSASNLPVQPDRWGFIPNFREFYTRLTIWLAVRRMHIAWNKLHADLNHARHLQEKITGLSGEIQMALGDLLQEATLLRSSLDEIAYLPALAYETGRLNDRIVCVEQSLELLDQPDPPFSIVVETNLVVQQTRRELISIEENLREHHKRQTELRPRLEQIRSRFIALEHSVVEENSQRPAPLLMAAIAELGRRWTDLSEALNGGDYPRLSVDLGALQDDLHSQEIFFINLLHERKNIAADCQRIDDEIQNINRWLGQIPDGYRMDRSRAFAHQLRSQLLLFSVRQRSEDLIELRQPRPLPFTEILIARQDFDRHRLEYEALRSKYPMEVVETMRLRSSPLVRRLGTRHPSYQNKAHLLDLRDQLAELQGNWNLVTHADYILESQIDFQLKSYTALDVAYRNLGVFCPQAERVLDQVKNDYDQALSILRFTIFDEMNAVVEHGTPELAEQAKMLSTMQAELKRRVAGEDEDFVEIGRQSQKLRIRAKQLSDEYQTRLDQLTVQVRDLRQRLVDIQKRLSEYASHYLLDFEARMEDRIDQIETWLKKIDTFSHGSLIRMTDYASEGRQLDIQVRKLCDIIENDIQRTEQARHSAGQAVRAAQDALQATDDVMPMLPWVSNNTNIDPLSSQRISLNQEITQLAEYEKPGVRHDPESAFRELNEIHDRAQRLQQNIETVRSSRIELTQRLNTLSQGAVTGPNIVGRKTKK